MTPTFDAALLIGSRAGTDLGRLSDVESDAYLGLLDDGYHILWQSRDHI